MIIKKVIIVFRNIVYDFLKVIPKKRFDTGKTSQYRYNSEIFFIDKSKKKLLAARTRKTMMPRRKRRVKRKKKRN